MSRYESIIRLVTDPEVEQLLDKACHHWTVAADRLEQLEKEQQAGLYQETGLELIAVAGRLEEVCKALIALPAHAQSMVLKGCHERLRKMCEDKRMDVVMARMLSRCDNVVSLKEEPSVWSRLYGVSAGLEVGDDKKAKVHQLLSEHVTPHLSFDELNDWMSPQQQNEELKEERDDALAVMAVVLDELKQFARDSTQMMSLAIAATTMIAEYVRGITDRSSMEPTLYAKQMVRASLDLSQSDEWQEYWQGHLDQLKLKEESLERDLAEVKNELLSMDGYLMANLERSEEAFGTALLKADWGDEDMLHLLFLLTKMNTLMEMLEKSAQEETADDNADDIEAVKHKVVECAMRLKEITTDRYYYLYEAMWQDFVECPTVLNQLTQCSRSKYNDGFNMMVLCHILGWLQHEYRCFGTRTLLDLGKTLGGPKKGETFKRYIGQKETLLTSQSINELREVIERLSSPR